MLYTYSLEKRPCSGTDGCCRNNLIFCLSVFHFYVRVCVGKGEGVTVQAACMHLHGLEVFIYLRQLTFNKHKRHIFKRQHTQKPQTQTHHTQCHKASGHVGTAIKKRKSSQKAKEWNKHNRKKALQALQARWASKGRQL